MKYKIKVEVKNDGSCKYYPMIKKHWWSRWKILHFNSRCFVCQKCYYDLEKAREAIKTYINMQLSHIYYISYKED